ncbi:TetR/AcrR family transcriptional regulator [Nocardia sp. 348MFTsu5.1]|uniref:TetR/AcrR family transcriptional regulator n=1 Tax=Nocardia sp. 348MFTsu5.1 TaxID=1172185 RepID=UPI00036ED6AB|nr:TetR/AcrR family transcriptional regulator [Nocardia sp. 348MFTsu5.1]
MGQPTTRSDTRRTRIRRGQLLDAALQTFIENGYSAVGVAEIVARIGCSHGTFYNYFDNKRDALDAVLERELAELTAIAELHHPRPRDATEFTGAMESLVRRLVDYVNERPDVLTFVVMEAPGVDDASLELLTDAFVRFGQLCGQYFRQGIADGYLREDLDIEFAGEAMVSCLLGAVLPRMLDNTAELDVEATVETVAGFLCYGTPTV